jgi:uncharacterized delta-60 repeat protein
LLRDPLGKRQRVEALGLGLQPDGGIVAMVSLEELDYSSKDVVLVRFAADGTRDLGFGVDGVVPVPLTSPQLAVDPSGAVLLAGESGPQARVTVQRLTPAGAPDPSFGNGGEVETGLIGAPAAIALDPAGRIVLGLGQFAVARLLPDGSLDSGFSGDGSVTAGGGREVTDLAIGPAGQVVVGGFTEDNFNGQETERIPVLARLATDGSLDRAFSGDGFRRLPALEGGAAVALDARGRLVAGAGRRFSFGTFEVRRVLPNGRLDRAFGNDGAARAALGATRPADGYVADVFFQPGGRIIAAGRLERGFFSELGYAAFQP